MMAFHLDRWTRDKCELLPLAEVRIGGKPVTLESLRRFTEALESALSTPMNADRTDYTPFFAALVDGSVDAKQALALIVMANYAVLAGRQRGADEQMLIKEMLFSDLAQYPFLLVDQAFKEWRRENTWFPTPCDIIRRIEGYSGEYDTRQQVSVGACGSIRRRLQSVARKMREIVEREEKKASPALSLNHETPVNFNFSTINQTEKVNV